MRVLVLIKKFEAHVLVVKQLYLVGSCLFAMLIYLLTLAGGV